MIVVIKNKEQHSFSGFYKLHFKKNFYCKVSGEVLDHEPKYLGIHGLTTITGIASEIERELIIREKEFDL